MELQSATSGLPGPLSPTLDYGDPLSPLPGDPGPSHATSPGRGTSPSLSPVRGPSPGFTGQAAFNYNQLEGRFKQLQGKTGTQLGILSKYPEKDRVKGELREIYLRHIFGCSHLEALSCRSHPHTVTSVKQ